MSRVRVSFVIPCYNIGKYIDDCLDSVYNQDVTDDLFEVICVDDCSTDETCEKIRFWQKKHSNLQLICHEGNRRQGATRNTGLLMAKGDFVWFVDGDDTIESNCLGTILKTLDDNDLDLLLFNRTADKSRITLQEFPICGIDYLEKWLRTGKLNDTMYCVWARVIKRELLIGHSLFFREDMAMVEDVSYSYKMCCFADRVMAVCDSYYFFREAIPSVTRSNLTAEKVFSAYSLTLRKSFSLRIWRGGVRNSLPTVSLAMQDGGFQDYRRKMVCLQKCLLPSSPDFFGFARGIEY